MYSSARRKSIRTCGHVNILIGTGFTKKTVKNAGTNTMDDKELNDLQRITADGLVYALV
jgi:hypothetical protein